MFGIPGITRARRLHESKFRRHGLAHDNCSSLAQEPDNAGIRGRAPRGIQHSSVLRRHICRIDDVLYADGHTGERQAAKIVARIQAGRLAPRLPRIEMMPGLDFALASLDAGQ